MRSFRNFPFLFFRQFSSGQNEVPPRPARHSLRPQSQHSLQDLEGDTPGVAETPKAQAFAGTPRWMLLPLCQRSAQATTEVPRHGQEKRRRSGYHLHFAVEQEQGSCCKLEYGVAYYFSDCHISFIIDCIVSAVKSWLVEVWLIGWLIFSLFQVSRRFLTFCLYFPKSYTRILKHY